MNNRSGFVPGSTPPAYLPPVEGAGPLRHKGKGYPPAPEPLPVPVMDNHTHFDFPADGATGDFAVALADALDAAEAVGVQGAIQVGTDLESSRFTAAAVDADPRLLGAVAIHPNDAPVLAAQGTLEQALAEIEALAAHPRIRAIGETGLDYFRTGEDGREQQHYSFRRHIDIAKRLGLALQIHDRDAHDDVVRLLKEEGAPETVVFHCFSGDGELARICNENGWYLSFSGTVTFKNSHNLHEALTAADRSLLLVETDAPFLTPHPHRGRPNASYMVPYTVRSMASRLDADLSELGAGLAANTVRAYGSWA
ncbi:MULTISPECIES: TatD family hydrolase [unclassified Arthrobacter]|uniref:TatD family hydrolase n=1 Tax=unclassified Arthrobacter TaxID=235627 RepID=UPI001E53D6CB|nr:MULTISPECIES: TatD family hydrolase [unclassified Arthrobacter]MCC9146125.1 TatD family hydrolase [Arthrobacter sp. zg-Y919]MDK1277354.1 TatD family hydrolase [Arthrobacter sp. zg.Y919]WIB03852.1 TatD family hydrolase [Arthrobacter sp. zg-Y919]